MKVGIGFITGRKSFQNVLRTNIYNWKEAGLTDYEGISLHLFVAYDLSYTNTKPQDYTNIAKDLVSQIDGSTFIEKTFIQKETEFLTQKGVISKEEAKLLFNKGYAAKRNAVMYSAIKQKMDCLIFLDDDEYPMAVTKTKQTAIWSGQHVLSIHLQNILKADITHGHHCGYISPIPYMEFNQTLTEKDFQSFIEAISNDIIGWDSIKATMKNGGVTYADIDVLTGNPILPVPEINKAKFISGANLCINLKDCSRVFPFYNPPDARGEDTFLSTCLSNREVLKVPCYSFHDGFLTYRHLLEGVLPIQLKFISANEESTISRFYKACIGWIRYKPLLIYLTSPDQYPQKMQEIHEKLSDTLPKICDFLDSPQFMNVLKEFQKYSKNVEKHADEFEKTKIAWAKIMNYFSSI